MIANAPGGAQDAAPVVSQIVADGTHGDQRISDDGNIVVFETTVGTGAAATTQVLIHDRLSATTVGVPESAAGVQTFNPAVSANGCFVTYSTFVPAVIATTTTSTTSTTTTTTTTSTTTTSTTTTTTTTTVPADSSTSSSSTSSSSTSSSSTSSSSTSSTSTGDVAVGTNVQPPVAGPSRPAAAQVVDTPAQSSLHAFDRCAQPLPSASVTVATLDRATPFPAAAVSSDGTVVAYSTGDDIVRMQGTLSGYTVSARFDSSPTPSSDVAVGSHLAISADGSVIAFEAAAGTDPLGVHLWTAGDSPATATVRRVATMASDPTLSADASLVAFEATAGSDSTFAGVVLQTVPDAGAPVNISIDPNGTRPDLSADGNHVVYNTTSGNSDIMAMTSWVGDGTDPFVSIAVVDLSAAVNGAPATTTATSGPVVSRLGDVVAFDAPAAGATAVSLRTLGASGMLDAASYDLGSADVGETLTATAVFTNQGPSSVEFAADGIGIEVDSPFTVVASTCAGVVRPGGGCSIDVALTITELEDIFGVLTVTTVDGLPEFALLSALGAEAASATPTVTTTPPDTTPQNTTRLTLPTTTPRVTTRVTTPNTTRTTVRTTTTRVTVAEIELPPVFDPTTFDFAPTIVDAGRRTASIDLVNPGSTAETFTAASFSDPTNGFSVTGSTCTSLGVGARCTIDLEFAPAEVGELSDELVVTFASGTRVEATITGIGAPAPTLTIIPEVATVGQVVTVQGSGFPAGATVALSFDDGIVERDVVVNDGGVFNLPLVVLPHTTPGPLAVEIAGQDDVFADVETEMLVTKTGQRNNSTVFGSLGARVGR